MSKANYSIVINTNKKTCDILVEGKMTMDVAQQFVAEYQRKTKSIDPSIYTLEVDCKSMKLLDDEMTADLEQVMGLYKQTGFKNMVFTTKQNVLLRIQLARLLRQAKISNATVVNI